MNDSLKAYRQSREALLALISERLAGDERFVAAWLEGSYGRGDADAVSDLDLSVVVSRAYSDALCFRPQQVSGTTTKERLDLFASFGRPVVIHENNHNAPEGGTFTFVLYHPSALVVDWMLIPHSKAQRPPGSRLLFDKVGLPLRSAAEPESLEQRAGKASEMVAFFWMMCAVTAKYIVRGDGVFVMSWLEELHKIAGEVERLAAGEARQYRRGSLTVLQSNRTEQKKALRQLCSHMVKLMSEVAMLGGDVPASPMPAIETILSLSSGK